MTFQMILWLSIGWLPILMCILLRNETKFKKNISLGVTMPWDARNDAEVIAELQRFQKNNTVVCAVLVLLAVGGALMKNATLSMALWGVWVLLAVAVPYVPYVNSHLALRRLKAARGWTSAQNQVVTVDTAIIQPMRQRSPLIYLPPFIVSLLPLLWERSLFVLYIVNALFVIFSWLGERYLLRSRAERIDDNAELTVVLTQFRRQYWGKMWLLVAWCLALVSPISAFSGEKSLLMGVLFIALLIVMLAFSLGIEFKLRRLQEKLTAQSGQGSYVDEDDKWIWGMFYYNPKDTKLIVNNRVGTNTTVNLALPAGKVIMALVALVLLAIPLIFPITEGAIGGVELTISGEVLDSGKYELPIGEIEEVELLDTLPKGLMRVMGTSMPNLLRGKFTAPSTGKLNVSINPTQGPWLLVTMQSGEKYLLGGSAVEEIFERLQP